MSAQGFFVFKTKKLGGIFMKLEKLVGERFRERPSDCVADSHAFMVRGGYMKPASLWQEAGRYERIDGGCLCCI